MPDPVAGSEGRHSAPLVLGIDLGTTGAKALLIDVETGAHRGRGYRGYPSATSTDGAHEQEPRDWWAATVAAVKQATGATPVDNLRCIGLSGHMHAVVLVDDHHRTVRPVLTWADRRSGRQVRRLRQSQAVFTERCANPVVEAFTAPKVAWVAEHEPESLERAVRLVQPKDVLRHHLTGTWGTDVTDARGTLLFDVRRNVWDEELWRMTGADIGLAPNVSSSTDVVGELTDRAASQLGLTPGTPVVAGAGDVACSALGAGVVRPGTIYVNAGTAAQILAPLEDAVDGSHFIFGRGASDAYLAMASVYAAGMSVDWAARGLVSRDVSPGTSAGLQMDAMALAARAGAAGAVFLPHLLGTSVPSHDPRVRGALLGLSADHLPTTLARAVLEGVAYACAAAVRHVAALAAGATGVRVGGGLAGSRVWCEALTAVHDVPVERVTQDASPVGAAMLAGIGIGAWAGADDAAQACVAAELLPRPESDVVDDYLRAQRRYDAAAEVLGELSQRIEFQPAGDAAGTGDEWTGAGVPA